MSPENDEVGFGAQQHQLVQIFIVPVHDMRNFLSFLLEIIRRDQNTLKKLFAGKLYYT
jgi:hypothetical protein